MSSDGPDRLRAVLVAAFGLDPTDPHDASELHRTAAMLEERGVTSASQLLEFIQKTTKSCDFADFLTKYMLDFSPFLANMWAEPRINKYVATFTKSDPNSAWAWSLAVLTHVAMPAIGATAVEMSTRGLGPRYRPFPAALLKRLPPSPMDYKMAILRASSRSLQKDLGLPTESLGSIIEAAAAAGATMLHVVENFNSLREQVEHNATGTQPQGSEDIGSDNIPSRARRHRDTDSAAALDGPLPRLIVNLAGSLVHPGTFAIGAALAPSAAATYAAQLAADGNHKVFWENFAIFATTGVPGLWFGLACKSDWERLIERVSAGHLSSERADRVADTVRGGLGTLVTALSRSVRGAWRSLRGHPA